MPKTTDGMMTQGETLRDAVTATRVSFEWLSPRRKVGEAALHTMAAATGCDKVERLSATKRIIDSKHERVAAINALRRECRKWWQMNTLPYVETGTRLIPNARVEEFCNVMQDYRSQIATAAAALAAEFEGIKEQARDELGDLFDERDYPHADDVAGQFVISWTLPSVVPPNYLKELNPELYEAEVAKMQQRFEESVQLAEDAFTDEFAKLVTELSAQMSQEDFRFPAQKLEKITAFVERFRGLSMGCGSDELERLIGEFGQVAGGVSKERISDEETGEQFRGEVSEQLSGLTESLTSMLEARPTRRIRRGADSTLAAAAGPDATTNGTATDVPAAAERTVA